MAVIDTLSLCDCGAMTVTGKDDDGNTFTSSVGEGNKDMLPDVVTVAPRNVIAVRNCNHCVNHWGLDLCDCGSGESPETCDCGANKPHDTYGVPRKTSGWGSCN